MPVVDPESWTDTLRRTLACYDEALLRRVASRLVKPRTQKSVEELIDRSVATPANAAVVDRRLGELEPAGRKLLACMGHSRQPRWRLGSLVEILHALGHEEGPTPVLQLFEAGLLYPDLFAGQPADGQSTPHLNSFEQWLVHAGDAGLAVFAHPAVLARARGVDLELPAFEGVDLPAKVAVHEADGLEWLLRLSAVWQQLRAGSLRRTQQGELFKRDLDRLRSDPVLNAPPADDLAELPDAALLAVVLAQAEGIAQVDAGGELQAGDLPAVWEQGLFAALGSLWEALSHLDRWNPQAGWRGGSAVGNPYPAAYLLAFLVLAHLPENAWARPDDLETWLLERHPFWQGADLRPSRRQSWLPRFLLGLAYQLRLVQASKDKDGTWLVRLSPVGRWVLGQSEAPPPVFTYAQTLLVQPNLEIIVYRQGLTPALIATLSRFATWKTLGSACTLQLGAESVYRGLESGLSFDEVLRTLEQHGMRPTPPAVVESLRTWADKRERITVYPSATLFEFGTPEELNEALARGLPGIRLSDRLLVVASEGDIGWSHFKLAGTRDYGGALERCVDVDPDGVTFTVDLTRSDLLLETELSRFAESLDGPSVNGRRRYRLTPTSLAAGREGGWGVPELEAWFAHRSGQPLSAAARLLLLGADASPFTVHQQTVLRVPSEELADGLVQWPGTRALVVERLGPTALVVEEEHLPLLKERLAAVGAAVNDREPTKPGAP